MKYPILLPNIFNYPFTYESEEKLKTGTYVKVPFGNKVLTGVVWDSFEKKSEKTCFFSILVMFNYPEFVCNSLPVICKSVMQFQDFGQKVDKEF